MATRRVALIVRRRPSWSRETGRGVPLWRIGLRRAGRGPICRRPSFTRTDQAPRSTASPLAPLLTHSLSPENDFMGLEIRLSLGKM